MKKNTIFLLIMSLITLMSNAQVPTAGLVGYWPFNGNGNDESGNGNDATVNGPVLTTDRFGQINKAYSFDGTNDYMDIGVKNFPKNNSAQTISVWAKFPATPVGTQHVVAIGNISKAANTALGFTNNVAMVWKYTGISLVECAIPSSNIWHHYLYVFDNLNNYFYIDNFLQATSQVSPNTATPNVAWFSKWNTSSFFTGQMDDIRIYNRALTRAEITELYYELTCPPPIITGNISICGSGQALFTASGGAIFKWYDAEIGGNLLYTGNPFYSPVVDSTTSFFAEADSGSCRRAESTITVTPLPVTPVVASSLLICPNSKTSITASGGTAYKWYDASEGGNLLYTGNPFITNPITVPAKFYVANYNATCESKRDTVNISLKPLPATPKITQNGNVLSSNITYGNQWGELISGPIDGATNQLFSPTYTGDYYVIVTDNGCLTDTSNLIRITVSSIQNISTNSHIKVYPNPTTGLVIIEPDKSINYKNGSIELLDYQGKSVYKTYNISSSTTIDLSGYPPGIYLIKITSEKLRIFQSIIKK
jgi:hypothetical protein